MSSGKLYRASDGEFLAEVKYHFLDHSATGWWGELTLTEYKRIKDGDGYLLETEEGTKGRCSLHKKVNKAVIGVPPLYFYHFRGRGPLK